MQSEYSEYKAPLEPGCFHVHTQDDFFQISLLILIFSFMYSSHVFLQISKDCKLISTHITFYQTECFPSSHYFFPHVLYLCVYLVFYWLNIRFYTFHNKTKIFIQQLFFLKRPGGRPWASYVHACPIIQKKLNDFRRVVETYKIVMTNILMLW